MVLKVRDLVIENKNRQNLW